MLGVGERQAKWDVVKKKRQEEVWTKDGPGHPLTSPPSSCCKPADLSPLIPLLLRTLSDLCGGEFCQYADFDSAGLAGNCPSGAFQSFTL